MPASIASLERILLAIDDLAQSILLAIDRLAALSDHVAPPIRANPAACFFRNSAPSSALLSRMSRVSSPVFGAKSRPIPTPIPSPRKKFAVPSFAHCCFLLCVTGLLPSRYARRAQSHSQYTSFRFRHTIRHGPSGTLLYSMRQPRKPRKLADEELFGIRREVPRNACVFDRRSAVEAAHARRAARPPWMRSSIVLKGVGYLDDQRFAETFASARLENDGFGRQRLLNDLRARRISGNSRRKRSTTRSTARVRPT